jgi:hypothetical protein
MAIARRLAVVALAACIVAGCSSGNSGRESSPAPPSSARGPVLEGTFTVKFDDGARTVNGKPMPTPQENPSTWGVRSACTGQGCVATRSVMKSGKPESPMVMDFVEGRWIGMLRSPDHQCKNGGTAPYYRWFSLEPRPDGTLAGETYWLYFGANCPQVTWLPMTATRTGDAPAGLKDPSAVPARKASAPEGFHGRYTSASEPVPGRKTAPPTTSDVQTMCVHNTDECATVETVTEATDGYRLNAAYQFTGGHWVATNVHDAPCGSGGRVTRQTTVWKFDLPKAITNPFAKITGTRSTSNAGNCGKPTNTEMRYTRVGG